MKTFIFIVSMFIFSNAQASFIDKGGEEIKLIWNKKGCLQAEKLVYITSNYESYKNTYLRADKIGTKDWYNFLDSIFEKEIQAIKNNPGNLYWLSAIKQNNYVVGFLSVEIEKQSQEAYIRHLAVLPKEWFKGIGTELVYSIVEQFPNIKKITMVTRKINTKATMFFQKIGFKKVLCKNHICDADNHHHFELKIDS